MRQPALIIPYLFRQMKHVIKFRKQCLFQPWTWYGTESTIRHPLMITKCNLFKAEIEPFPLQGPFKPRWGCIVSRKHAFDTWQSSNRTKFASQLARAIFVTLGWSMVTQTHSHTAKYSQSSVEPGRTHSSIEVWPNNTIGGDRIGQERTDNSHGEGATEAEVSTWRNDKSTSETAKPVAKTYRNKNKTYFKTEMISRILLFRQVKIKWNKKKKTVKSLQDLSCKCNIFLQMFGKSYLSTVSFKLAPDFSHLTEFTRNIKYGLHNTCHRLVNSHQERKQHSYLFHFIAKWDHHEAVKEEVREL